MLSGINQNHALDILWLFPVIFTLVGWSMSLCSLNCIFCVKLISRKILIKCRKRTLQKRGFDFLVN